MRTSKISRKTGETDIQLSLNLDEASRGIVNSGNGFLDHMLDLFQVHGGFRLYSTLLISAPSLARRWSNAWATRKVLNVMVSTLSRWTKRFPACALILAIALDLCGT